MTHRHVEFIISLEEFTGLLHSKRASTDLDCDKPRVPACPGRWTVQGGTVQVGRLGICRIMNYSQTAPVFLARFALFVS
jgi:hypothetical protein